MTLHLPPPHVAAWALDRIKADPRLAAEVDAAARRLKRDYPRMTPEERVLHADPITIGVSLLAVVGVTSASAAVAWTVGAIVLVGASIAVNYAVSALTRKSSGAGSLDAASASAAAINAPAIKYNERQAIPSKRIIYGTAQVGGALFFERVKPPYLYMGHLVNAGQITRWRQMWVGTNLLAFAALAPGVAMAPLPVTGQADYPNHLLVSLRNGAADQAIDPLLGADFPSLDPEFRQRGIATAVVRYDYGADFDAYTALWGQASRPNPLWLVDGVAVPDPRKPGHILDWDPSDPDSVAEAVASWSWSNNAALVQSHYLTQRYGGRILPSRVNWDKVATSADWDDGLVYCNDGSFIKRHTIDGVVTLNQSPADVLAAMVSANRGFVLESAGRVWPGSSLPRKSVATITDALLTGAVDYRGAKPKRDMANRVKVRFVAEDREYQTADGPVLNRADLQAIDGELLDATLELPFTMDNRRAQRLEKAFLETSRLGRQVVVTCDVALLAECSDELIGNAVTFDSALFAQANGVYFCGDWGFADGFSSIQLTLTEYNASIETDYVAANDEKPFVLADLDVS